MVELTSQAPSLFLLLRDLPQLDASHQRFR